MTMPKGYEHLAPPPSSSPPPSSGGGSGGGTLPSSSGGGGGGGIVLVFMFIISILLMIAVVFTLNKWLLLIGGIMFLASILGLTWGQPTRRGHHGHSYGSNGYWQYRYGSGQAKRNMYRGYRYSKKRR